MTNQRSRPDYSPATIAIAVYAVLVLVILPASAYARMLGGAAILIAAAAVVAPWISKSSPPAMSMLIVSFAGIAVLVIPNFRAMGGENGPALPIGFLGSQAIALLWATLIRPGRARSLARVSLGDAFRFAMFGAAILSAIASIPIAWMLFHDAARALPFLLVYPAYFLGGFATAVIYWLFRGVAHRAVGPYVIGALGGTCMYTAVAPIVYLSQRQPIPVGEMLEIGIVCGFLVGPPVALSMNDPLPGSSPTARRATSATHQQRRSRA
ncbi:MAG: hypothetical protein HOQ09_11135 [Gemmatimonadaceae bacterium]|nr:hypothetical protein [Gemmatimonadaceae bacterium]